MGKAITAEQKKNILNARGIGKEVKEICEIFPVKKSAVYNLYNKYDETQKIEEPKKSSGRPPQIDGEQLEKIREKLTEKNDITLAELIEELELGVCQSALSRTLRKKLDSHYKKKTLHPKEQEREDVKKNEKNGGKSNQKWT